MEPNNLNQAENQKSIGPAIGIIIIIAIIVIGGLYFWSQRQKQNITPRTPAESQNDEYETQLQTQGSSDELGPIEADARATSFNEIGGEVDTAEREVSQ